MADLPRNEPFNYERNEKLALRLANKFGKCLVMYWDDRIDLALANLYEQNSLIEEFDHKDEIWLELKANGCPNFQGLKYSRFDIESNFHSFDNFVCVFNCIDAALYSFDPFCELTCVGFITKICSFDDV